MWELLEGGAIPYKVEGNIRKMRYEDVIEYKHRQDAERMKAVYIPQLFADAINNNLLQYKSWLYVKIDTETQILQH